MSLAAIAMRSGAFALLAGVPVAAPGAAWADRPTVSWEERIEVAAGGGHRGPWRMNESDYDYVDDPTVAISEQGVVGVAWADQSRQDIFLRVYEPDGSKRFNAPVNVSRSPKTFSWLPRMLVSSGDASQVFILWQEIVFSPGGSHGGEIFFARSTDGGRSFGAPLNLSNSRAGDGKGRTTRRYWHNGSLDLALARDGTLFAAWTEYEGALWLSRSVDGGESFAAPLRVAGEAGASPARGPSLAVDAESTVHLAWAVGEDPAANIHFATSTDRGRSFGEPRIVARSEGHADAPKLTVDAEGTVHLVYAESPAGPFEAYHVRYTRLSSGADAFEASRQISQAPAAEHESAGFPALSLDGTGRVFVLWELFPGRRGYSQGLGFTHSADGGQSFAAPKILPGSRDAALGFNGSQQGLLMRKLAVNLAGALAVVNSTFKSNATSRIWLLRGRMGGG